MTMRVALFAGAALLALAAQPAAAQTNGWYAGLAGGANWVADGDVNGVAATSGFDVDTGWAALGKVGYGFGDVRVEGELSHRQNDIGGTASSGDLKSWGAMANVLYDFAGMGRFVPYVGFGVGAMNFAADGRFGNVNVDDNAWVPAVQGILGANFEITDNILIGADYRYITGANPKFDSNVAGSYAKADNSQHTVMVGMTYRFGAPAPKPAPVAAVAPPPPPPPPPPPAPAVQAPPPPPPARLPETYVVFFAFDKSDISPVASQVLDRAIADYRSTGMTRIVVEGHTDRSGKDVYNQRLSERRSKSVADYLVAKGIAGSAIQTAGFGESRPRVPTADGERNDENRRAEIFLRK